MFERYTERARRALFFARYESSQLGSMSIEPEHILLGVLREKSDVTRQILAPAGVTLDAVTDELQRKAASREKISTSVEIPFSLACKHVLQYAAEEADTLQHAHIGTEHLLLGVLREGQSPAAQLLAHHGIRLTDVRQQVAAAPTENTLRRSVETAGPRLAGDDDEVRRRIKEIRDAAQLIERQTGDQELRELAAGIRQALDDLESYLLS